jgi:regulator of protease activity HflC (stomatin/prohibitin superfamily)
MIATIFLVFCLIVFIVGIAMRKSNPKRGAGTAAAALVALLVGLVFSTSTIVPTREVGIVTTFGRPVGEIGNGFHLKAPWQKVTTMDAAIQLQNFAGNTYDEHGTAIPVRLKNNSMAYVNVNIAWRIDPDAAMNLFLDYRGFENIQENLVDKQLAVATAHVFGTFDPQTTAQGADLSALADDVKAQIQEAVGDRIKIEQVFIPAIFYDQATQQRLDAYNQKVQETKNAQQDVQTAEQSRLAAEARARQTPPDLRIAISNCLNDMVKSGRDPAGCWGQPGGQPLIQIPRPTP